MNQLIDFVRSLEATYSDAQWGHARIREAERLQIEPTQWARLRSMPVDLVMVREAHRCVSTLSSVRRADRDGEWTLVSAQEGRLRSQPQSFRVGSHVEPAWDHKTLRRRVANLVNETRNTVASSPMVIVARFLHSFVRAQAFLGRNEQVALLVSSVVLRSVGLPGLSMDMEHDPHFQAALIASDDVPLQALLSETLWNEALSLVEWLPPNQTTSRWSLADEHEACVAQRKMGDVEALEQELLPALRRILPDGIEVRRAVHLSFTDRLRAASDCSLRGHSVCPRHSIVETRFSLPDGRDAVLVTALAGRGIGGAALALLSIEHPRVLQPKRAPALLLPLAEPSPDRQARWATWVLPALTAARH